MSEFKGSNPLTRTYIYASGSAGGVGVIGWAHAHRMMAAVCEWMRFPCPDVEVGTEAHYAAYRLALTMGQKHFLRTATKCPAMLYPVLIPFEGQRVEVRSTDGSKRRFIVGKSVGWMPVHLEMARKDSKGGSSCYLKEGDKVSLVYDNRSPKRKRR